jgi:chromatin segregation and condensation protein Rec8/ScpA/Scc1 (kleisin family)
VTLLAMLELVRQGRIRTQQTELFGDIVIERGIAAPAAGPPGEISSAESN